MGLHSYLAQQLIEYDLQSSRIYKHLLYAFELLTFWQNQTILRERGITPSTTFEKSDYAMVLIFDKYTSGQFVPKSDRVKELFEGIFIPSAADWAELRDKVKDGLTN